MPATRFAHPACFCVRFRHFSLEAAIARGTFLYKHVLNYAVFGSDGLKARQAEEAKAAIAKYEGKN